MVSHPSFRAFAGRPSGQRSTSEEELHALGAGTNGGVTLSLKLYHQRRQIVQKGRIFLLTGLLRLGEGLSVRLTQNARALSGTESRRRDLEGSDRGRFVWIRGAVAHWR